MARCAKLPRVIGVKDATADLVRPMLTRIAIGPQFCQLSGEDGTVVPFLAQGGTAASPSPRTWRRGSAPSCTRPGSGAISTP